MKKEVTKELEKNQELIRRITDKDESIIIGQYNQLKDKNLTTLDDYEKAMKLIYISMKHTKREQMLIRQRIDLLNQKYNSDGCIKQLWSLYRELEKSRIMLNQTLDFLTKIYEIFRNEPEKQFDPILQANLKQKYDEILSKWSEIVKKNK